MITTSERQILNDLGVESFGVYASKTGPLICIRFKSKKANWEKDAIKKYLLDISPSTTFLL